MGYYSNWRLMTTVEGRKALEDYVKIHTPEGGHNLFNQLTVDKASKDTVLVGMDDVKFNLWYPEVKTFLDGLDYLKDDEIPYKFIRIGEDIDDMEEDDCNQEELDAELYIKRDFGVYDFE